MKDIYEQLRETLDGYGIGFPSVPGADVAYLKSIFTEEHARVFLAMENRFQPATEVAERLNQTADEVKAVLDAMADKGLVMTSTKTDPPFYAPLPWLTGWGDWTAYWEDKKTALLELEYRKGFAQAMMKEDARRPNIFRTVPVYETIPDKSTVAPHDNIRSILERAGTISLANCYCDMHRKKTGEKTTEPLERCFLFGTYADYLIEKGFGRKVTVDEAMAVMNKCEEAGLVHNVTNLENPIFVCNCPDYCGSNLGRRFEPIIEGMPRINNFFASVIADECTGCQTCVEYCPLKVISMGSEGVAEINGKLCVGCGVCASKCPSGALTLKERSGPEHYTPVATNPMVRSSEEYGADLESYGDIIKPKG
jgi:Na+-translocating ferredoxin:NAD+ oxidoreductase subunit B